MMFPERGNRVRYRSRSATAERTSRWPWGRQPRLRPGHVESHFFKATSPDASRALWLKHTVLAPCDPAQPVVSESWAIVFDRERMPLAIKHVQDFRATRTFDSPFSIDSGHLRIDNGSTAGCLSDGAHEIRWSLTMQPLAPVHVPFPLRAMYDGPVPSQKALTPYPNARIGGQMFVSGELWDVAGWSAMQGHNWGRRHTPRYLWMHFGAVAHPAHGSVWVELMSGRLRVAGRLLPHLSVGAASVGGRLYRFTGPRALLSREVRTDGLGAIIAVESSDGRLEIEASAPPALFAGLRYENPDGSHVICLNTKLADARLRLQPRRGAAITIATRAMALEIGDEQPDPRVPVLV